MSSNLTNGSTFKFDVTDFETNPIGKLNAAGGIPISSSVKIISLAGAVVNTTCGNDVLDEYEVCEGNMTSTCADVLGNSMCSGAVSCNELYCSWDTLACDCECDESAKPSAGDWSECSDGRQSKPTYFCDASVGRWEYDSEVRACVDVDITVDEGISGAWFVGGGILAALAGAFALWYFYLGPKDLLLGAVFGKWFGRAPPMDKSAEEELKKYASK